MKRLLGLLSLFCFSCAQQNEVAKDSTDSTKIIPATEIPETRTAVKTTPAAEYSEPIKDELNDWKFSVALYETKRTFHYAVRIQGKEMRISDSINIPNFGTEPQIEIRKGKEPHTAVIGFLDKKNIFQDYREISFKDDRLHIKTLHTYSVGSYKTKVAK